MLIFLDILTVLLVGKPIFMTALVAENEIIISGARELIVSVDPEIIKRIILKFYNLSFAK